MKKILIITSVTTGSGHKSICDSLIEQFELMPDVNAKAVDGFDMAGSFAYHSSYIYGMLTRHCPWLYNLFWKITDNVKPGFRLVTHMCRQRFLELVRSFEPDLIISVHSFFNTSLTNLIKTSGLSIPVAVVQADLVSIHSTWCNPDADVTLCPTEEAYEISIKHGMPREKLKVIGFPVRKKFADAHKASSIQSFARPNPISVLLMGGGEGSRGLKTYADILLKDPDIRLTIICGRNVKLLKTLQKQISPQDQERVEILGFIDDIEQRMLDNDILIARGSPNTLTEAVMMGIPVILTGPFLEQERGNYRLAEEQNIGVVCKHPNDILTIINDLLDNDGAALKNIREAQDRMRTYDNARDIASYVCDLINRL